MRILIVSLFTFVFIATAAAWTASLVQRDFGNVDVTNVAFENAQGATIRAKLYRHHRVDVSHKGPGVVYLHGYQSNRESGDPSCIEISRRGVVSLCIDLLGRGNSDSPGFPDERNFDETFGAKASIAYIKRLPFVDASRVGIIGNSIGGELAFEAGLSDPSLRATVFTGFAFDKRATKDLPKNMLMLFGDKDEYRKRMLGTATPGEWEGSDLVKSVFFTEAPKASFTYGNFEDGTARRVEFPSGIHLKISHSRGPIASTLVWIQSALTPSPSLWKDASNQIWPVKEWATLIAMLFGIFSVLPLLSLLLRIPFFTTLLRATPSTYIPSVNVRLSQLVVNALLMWLYPVLVLILFAVHIYVVRIDRVFPMMMVDGIVFWFFIVNIVGLVLFIRWRKKNGFSSASLGLSSGAHTGRVMMKTAALAALLFLFVCGLESIFEIVFNVDYRFIFPFASDWTAKRLWMGLRYFPFILTGFICTGVFLHVQLKRPERSGRFWTFLDWSFYNTSALVVPLLLLLAAQYIPLYTLDIVPLVGPGGGLVSFIMNLFHVCAVLALMIPISTYCFMETKTPYLGAFLSALLVTWMFMTSQVIAPLPV